ncbi:hypothetical protein D3C81_793260 [compost metagenome]
MYGLLTGTSAYRNSAGNADWAREQLKSAFFESKEAEYIANLALVSAGGIATRNPVPRNSPSEMGNRNTARGAGKGVNPSTLRENGEPYPTHSTVTRRNLDPTGEPNSSVDLYDKNGVLKQRRYYGPDEKHKKTLIMITLMRMELILFHIDIFG